MPNTDGMHTKLGEGRQAEILGWTEGTVLKLFRDPGAHIAAEWEAIATGAAASACARAPAVHGVISFQDRPGLIMDRADGPDLLTLLGRQPWKLFRAARLLGQLHAEIHGVSAPPELPGLRVAQRQRIEVSGDLPSNFRRLVLGVLETLPDGDRLCHGDMHPGNIMMSHRGPMVIDWTNARRGHPAADIARSVLILDFGAPLPTLPALIHALTRMGRRLFSRAYLRAYRRVRPIDERLVARWEVVCAADRITEQIEGEKRALLKLLEYHASRLAHR